MSFDSSSLFVKTIDKETLAALRASSDQLNKNAQSAITERLPKAILNLWNELELSRTDPTFLFHRANDVPSGSLITNFDQATEAARTTAESPPFIRYSTRPKANLPINGGAPSPLSACSIATSSSGSACGSEAGGAGGEGDVIQRLKLDTAERTEERISGGMAESEDSLEALRYTYVDTPRHIALLQQHLHDHALNLLRISDDIGTWLDMLAPALEEGNPTNVDIQGRCNSGLGSFQSFLSNFLSSETYSVGRGNLAWKVMRWPAVADYRVALARHDLAECEAARRSLRNLHYWAMYVVNLFHKNLPKIEDPSMAATTHMY